MVGINTYGEPRPSPAGRSSLINMGGRVRMFVEPIPKRLPRNPKNPCRTAEIVAGEFERRSEKNLLDFLEFRFSFFKIHLHGPAARQIEPNVAPDGGARHS